MITMNYGIVVIIPAFVAWSVTGIIYIIAPKFSLFF